MQLQETARNINSSPNYLGKISLTHYLLLHPMKDWQKNLHITSLKKILNIRKLFDGIPNYKPKSNDVPQLNRFSTLSESQLYRIIIKMPSRTCELDKNSYRIPQESTCALYTGNNQCCQLIIKHGALYEDWKLAIGRPLIESIKKGTEKSNYRPVSNLQFIKKCTLNQLPDHCNKYNLLPEYQSAYSKYYSCMTSLLKLVNDAL